MYHHRIPCYGDLTPGIPDVENAAKSLAAFGVQRPASGVQLAASSSPLPVSGLFACLRLVAGSRRQGAGSRTLEAGGGEPAAGSGQLEALLTVARDFSPRVMRASDVEILLDVSGLGRLIGPPQDIERQLAHAMFDAGLPARVAIGPTQTIARLLAATSDGVTLRHEDHKEHQDHEALCDRCDLRGLCAGACARGTWTRLPVRLLQPLEAGLKACATAAMNERDRLRPYETLQRWGIETLGELAALPAADLSSRLGRRGLALQRLARGLDPRPFVPDGETPRFTARLELEWPIDALEPLSFVLARLLEPLSSALDRADRGAVAIRLELRLTDRSTCTRVLPLPAPMRDPRVLRTLLLLNLESGPLPAAVDVVAIELDPAPARITQFSLLERALPSPETLSTLNARLAALVGEARVGSAVLLDSHAPDAFAMTRFAPAGAGGADRAEGADGAGADRAEGADGAVLRRQRTSLALRVSCEQGRPVHLAASRRGVPYGAIAQAAGPWRTSGGWWTEQQWNRSEWDVALTSGAVCRIYQDRTTRRWFLDGVYD